MFLNLDEANNTCTDAGALKGCGASALVLFSFLVPLFLGSPNRSIRALSVWSRLCASIPWLYADSITVIQSTFDKWMWFSRRQAQIFSGMLLFCVVLILMYFCSWSTLFTRRESFIFQMFLDIVNITQIHKQINSISLWCPFHSVVVFTRHHWESHTQFCVDWGGIHEVRFSIIFFLWELECPSAPGLVFWALLKSEAALNPNVQI